MNYKYVFEQKGFKFKFPNSCIPFRCTIAKKLSYVFSLDMFNALLKENNLDLKDVKVQPFRSTLLTNSGYLKVTLALKPVTKVKPVAKTPDLLKGICVRINKDISEANSAVTNIVQQIAKLNTELAKKKKTLTDTQNSLKSIESLGPTIEKILKVPGVTDVSFADSYLIVFTGDNIVSTGHGGYYNIGKLAFKIAINNSTYRLTRDSYGNYTSILIAHATDLKFERRKYPHPHVDTNGHACFGNIASTIERLFDKKDYLSLVIILMMYAKSYANGGEYAPMVHIGTANDRSTLYQATKVKSK